MVEARGSGRLCGQAIQDQNISGIIGRNNSGVAQSKGGGWWGGGGGGYTAGDGERSRKQLKQWSGDIYDVKFATDPKLGAVPDRGWNITTS